MDERVKYLKELRNAYKTKDIVTQLSDFKMITNSLFKLTQSLFDNNEKFKYFYTELENKYFRYGIANQSIAKLMGGNKFKLIELDIKITDLFSIFSLTRMQIESYALMFYLFYEGVTATEKDFRYDIYKLNGLIKQSKFKVKTEISIGKKNKILEEIETIKQKITQYETFKNSSEKQQKEMLNPKKAMLNLSRELLTKSGLESSRIDEMWALYSNYAHSEYISDRQFNSIYKINKSTLEETILALNINSIITAKLCIFLCNSFEGVMKKYNELDTKERVHIEIWNKMYN
ncbi:MAG: hypothetical protein H7Y10_06855 [Flavobacterium sp.]|nr:hypothetical protein [Flavobacterium sp.]